MLEEFRLKGVQVNSVEQWLDMEIPESKMMLSLYLSQGEVERHKISARIKDGNYKALSSGYYINKAPYSYCKFKPTPKTKKGPLPQGKRPFLYRRYFYCRTNLKNSFSY